MLIKAVMFDKPAWMHKVLIGLNQKGKWPGIGASTFSYRGCRATGREARPNPMIHEMNEVTPLSSRKGKRTVRRADRTADEG